MKAIVAALVLTGCVQRLECPKCPDPPPALPQAVPPMGLPTQVLLAPSSSVEVGPFPAGSLVYIWCREWSGIWYRTGIHPVTAVLDNDHNIASPIYKRLGPSETHVAVASLHGTTCQVSLVEEAKP